MTVKIQFLLSDNTREECIPNKIRLTNSVNKETGTILLTFSKVFSLELLLNQSKPIVGLYIINDAFFFYTKEIRCIWKNGRPVLIQAIFLIDKKDKLIPILEIMRTYATDNGLIDYTLEHN